MPEMKNVLEKINSSLDNEEEKIPELEQIAIEVSRMKNKCRTLNCANARNKN